MLDDDVARLARGVGADDALDGLDGADEGGLVLERVEGSSISSSSRGTGRGRTASTCPRWAPSRGRGRIRARRAGGHGDARALVARAAFRPAELPLKEDWGVEGTGAGGGSGTDGEGVSVGVARGAIARRTRAPGIAGNPIRTPPRWRVRNPAGGFSRRLGAARDGLDAGGGFERARGATSRRADAYLGQHGRVESENLRGEGRGRREGARVRRERASIPPASSNRAWAFRTRRLIDAARRGAARARAARARDATGSVAIESATAMRRGPEEGGAAPETPWSRS